MTRTPGQSKDGMDKLKFDGKTFYAWGEYKRRIGWERICNKRSRKNASKGAQSTCC